MGLVPLSIEWWTVPHLPLPPTPQKYQTLCQALPLSLGSGLYLALLPATLFKE